MTHLDNGREVGLGRVWMGLVVVVGLPIPPTLPKNQAGRGMGFRNEGSLSPLNPMLCPLLHAILLSTLPGCWARCFPAQPSCVVWPELKDKCRLQPEPPSLLLSRQLQKERGAEEAFRS